MEKSKKKKKEVRCYKLSGTASFKGFIKNGLDSSTIINQIVAFDGKYEEFKSRGFKFPPNLFYSHEISRSETIGVLINEFNFSKDEAIEAYNHFLSQFELEIITRIPEKDPSFENIVEDANNRVVKKTNNKKLKIGIPDQIIIAGFFRENINLVHSGDKGFIKTCEELNLNTIPMPERDKEKENEIRKLMKKRKN